MIKDRTGFTTYPHYKNTTFNFSTNIPDSFRHNQHYVTARKEVMDFLGETLSSHADEANNYFFNTGIHSAFNDFLKEFTDTRILQSKKLRQKFIDRFKKKITKLVPEIVNNPKYHTIPKEIDPSEDDFNFDELDAAPLLSGDIDFGGCTADDFDFEELDLTENVQPVETTYECPMCQSGLLRLECLTENKWYWKCTDTAKCKTIYNDARGKPAERIEQQVLIESVPEPIDEFDFTEFDETEIEEPLTNAPTFLFSGEGYKLYISFKHMTFKATGIDRDVVYALQNLGTLVLINHKFLTAKNHPEWLYCSFEDDLEVIFNKLTTGFSYLDQKEIDEADRFIETSMYMAVLNYRNRLGYFKYHKPFVFEHE